VPKREVARQFGLSPTRIWLIVRRIRADRALAERRRTISEAIRQADDLEKKWAVVDLADAMKLGTMTRNALLRHYERLETKED